MLHSMDSPSPTTYRAFVDIPPFASYDAKQPSDADAFHSPDPPPPLIPPFIPPSLHPTFLHLHTLFTSCQRHLHTHPDLTLLVFFLASLLLLTPLVYLNSFAASVPSSPSPTTFTCHDILFSPSSCGHMGEDCAPFTSTTPNPIRCPARCDYQPYMKARVYGTAPHYRADSYVCTAAIHAGVISTYGGCAGVVYTGPHADYPETEGSGGLTSVEGDGWYPKSFTIVPVAGQYCEYFHWTFLWLGLSLFFVLSLLRPPPMVYLMSLLLYGYYYTASSMDDGHTQEEIFFIATERLFYVMAFGWIIAYLGPLVTLTAPPLHHALEPLHPLNPLDPLDTLHPLSPTLDSSPPLPLPTRFSTHCTRLHGWWYAYTHHPFTLHLPSPSPAPPTSLFFFFTLPYFAALHWGYLSLYLPDIDLNAQAFSHGIAGLILILIVSIVIFILILYQLRLVFTAGLIRKYLLAYVSFATVILYISLLWSGSYSFHLHHALIGPLLIPLTRFRTRLSLLLQGLLLGVFINGMALWGFSSLWDHTGGASGSQGWDATEPRGVEVVNVTTSAIQVEWEWRNTTGSAIGTVVYINGVEGFHASWERTELWVGHSNTTSGGKVGTIGMVKDVYTEVGGRVQRWPGMAVTGRAELGGKVVGDGDVELFGRAWIGPVWPSLNYTVDVCYLFTYGGVGPCTSITAMTLNSTKY